MATSHIADLAGRVLGGRYRLTRRLGQGAFAQVYVADDVTLRRRVAIKVLNPALADERAFLRRFAAEAQAVAGLRHPHILRVYDWGEDSGDPYLVMELLEGGSLRSFLDQGRRLSPAQAARVGADVAKALDYAHRRGLVHRDIKPANLIFDDEGRIALADFGLARALAEATLTEPAGTVIGTARYAAPEQIHGESLDHRADVYALALVLVEATTGQVPFALDTSLATLMRRLRQPITVTADLGPLTAVIEAAGTVAADERIDAGEMARRLEGVAAELPPPARLVLAGPLDSGEVDVDQHPTEVPGRPGLFDIETVEAAEGWRDPGGPGGIPPVSGSGEPAPVRGGRAAGAAPDRSPTAGPPAAPTHLPPSPPPASPASGTGGSASAQSVVPAVERTLEAARSDTPDPGDDQVRRRRRRWPWVVLAFVGVVIVAAAAAAGYVVTRPAPTYPVPALHGDTVAGAAATLDRLHLELVVTDRTYDPTGVAGTILSQQPSGGRLTKGKAVDVVVSKGPQPVPVPSLADHTLTDARTTITRLGLKVGEVSTTTSMTVPSGSVVSATPSTGTLLPGQAVALVVSKGKPSVLVPLLSGTSVTSYSAAASALAALGLEPTETEQYSDTVPDGEVIVTDPAPGVTAVVGSSITVEVSKGQQMVAVPNVYGDSVTGAAQTLSGDGLVAGGVSGNPIGTVESTSPGQGTMVVIGSSVELITG